MRERVMEIGIKLWCNGRRQDSRESYQTGEIRGRTGRRARQKQKDRETDREGEFIVKFLSLLCFCFVASKVWEFPY